MAQFLVKVADDRGHMAQQVEHGYSEAEVRERFVQQGYLVYSVKPRGILSGGKLQLGGRKVKQSQFVIFNSQFLTLIKAGLPILNSLDLLIKRQKDSNLKSLLQNVRERVKSGELLSDSFAAQGVFPKIYTTTLLAGGLPLVPSLETAGASMSSRRILNGIVESAARVREGQTLSGSLEQQHMFPDLSVEMIEVGESTGALPAMLNSVAEFYEEDVQTALGATMALIEPVILIIMAVFVGGVLISLYLPIFSLGSNIH